ncbi:MAG: hypothetical protein Q7S36_02995 [Candidatus Liptonbacteria bacterium]|nr:hypothetical protein [Candidatus Liptonbacteria bacterium]
MASNPKSQKETSVKLYLGVVGEKRAGKDTFCDIFRHLAESERFIVSVHSYSDIIGKCLDTLCLSRSRENMQKFSPAIEKYFGAGTLSRTMTERVLLTDADIVIIQGIRWMTDLEELRWLGGTLVYVTADKEVRFARSRRNSEKPDEMGISREKFEEQENAQTELYIPQIAVQADFRFDNNGTEKEFATGVAKFAARYLSGETP